MKNCIFCQFHQEDPYCGHCGKPNKDKYHYTKRFIKYRLLPFAVGAILCLIIISLVNK